MWKFLQKLAQLLRLIPPPVAEGVLNVATGQVDRNPDTRKAMIDQARREADAHDGEK